MAHETGRDGVRGWSIAARNTRPKAVTAIGARVPLSGGGSAAPSDAVEKQHLMADRHQQHRVPGSYGACRWQIARRSRLSRSRPCRFPHLEGGAARSLRILT